MNTPSLNSGLPANPQAPTDISPPTTLANDNIQMALGIHGLTLSPDASLLYFIQTPDGSVSYIHVMDTRTQTIVQSYSPEIESEKLAGLSPDGTRAYVHSGRSNYIWVIDTESHEIKKGADLEGGATYMVVSKDGKHLYACGYGYVKAIETANQKVVKTLEIESYPFGIAINPSGSRVYVAHRGEAESDTEPTTIDVIDTKDLTTVARIPIRGAAYSMTVSSDGTRLYVANLTTSEILAIDTATNTIIKVVESERHPKHVSVSADGKHVYVVTYTSGFIGVLDAESLEAVQVIDTGKTDLREVLARPDNGIFLLYWQWSPENLQS